MYGYTILSYERYLALGMLFPTRAWERFCLGTHYFPPYTVRITVNAPHIVPACAMHPLYVISVPLTDATCVYAYAHACHISKAICMFCVYTCRVCACSCINLWDSPMQSVWHKWDPCVDLYCDPYCTYGGWEKFRVR